jgi:hypothetical protein
MAADSSALFHRPDGRRRYDGAIAGLGRSRVNLDEKNAYHEGREGDEESGESDAGSVHAHILHCNVQKLRRRDDISTQLPRMALHRPAITTLRNHYIAAKHLSSIVAA